MSIAMVGGLLVSSIVTGRLITSTGRWKRYLVGGMVLVVIVGLALLGHDRRARPPGRRRRLHGRPRPRPRRHHAEPRARRAEQHRRRPTWAPPARSSRSSARWAARSASRRWAPCWPPGGRQVARRTGAAGRPPERRTSSHAIPDLATLPGAGARGLRARVRRGDRSHLPGGRAVRGRRAGLRALHQGGPVADHDPASRRGRPRGRRRRPAATRLVAMTTATRADAARPRAGDGRAGPPDAAGHRRAGPRRAPGPAAGVVPDARATSSSKGPLRASAIAEAFDIDKGAVSRQVQHLVDLGLVERAPDPDDGRATLVAASDEADAGSTEVARHRRKWLDERLGDWSAEDDLAALRRRRSAATTRRSTTEPPASSRARRRCRAAAVATGPLLTSTSPVGQRHRAWCRS